jgi:hypothetical protein
MSCCHSPCRITIVSFVNNEIKHKPSHQTQSKFKATQGGREDGAHVFLLPQLTVNKGKVQ